MSAATIMLVDDDEDIREIVSIVLQGEGYATVDARDGLEALALLTRGERPPLILLDMMMPRLNGADLLRRMKADPALAKIPVVVMSGDTAARRTARELGAVGCLAKPVELDELIAWARRYGEEAGGNVTPSAPGA